MMPNSVRDADRFGCLRRRVRVGDGLTLIELLIGMTVLALLATIGLISYSSALGRARVVQAIGDLVEIESAIKDYQAVHRRLPDSLEEIGIEELVDPWGASYEYLVIDGDEGCRLDHAHQPLNTDFDLYSRGPDGATNPWVLEETGVDDVVRAADGEHYGVGEKF